MPQIGFKTVTGRSFDEVIGRRIFRLNTNTRLIAMIM